MKFIIDAQLPVGIARILNNRGHDAIYTDDLPDKERTTDNQIREISINEGRIVVTKDADFIDSHLIKGIPDKLVLISTGNIKNKELFTRFTSNLDQIIGSLESCRLVEMNNYEIIEHD